MVSTVTDRLQGFSIGAAIKAPVYVATTSANITLESSQLVDGLFVGSSQRVLVKDQTDPAENGIYISNSSTWTRAADADGNLDIKPGTFVYVDRGTVAAQSFWVFNSSSTALTVTAGTDDITMSQVTVALAGVTVFGSSLIGNADAAGARTDLLFPTTSINNSLVRADGTIGLYQDSSWVLGDASTLTAGGPFLSSAINMGDAALTTPKLLDYSEEQTTPSGGTNVLTLNIALGNVFETTLTENVTTLTISNPSASGDACSFTLIAKQDGTGGWAITWPAAIKWAGGTAPTVSTAASAVDVFTFVTTDGGTTWYGFTSAQDLV